MSDTIKITCACGRAIPQRFNSTIQNKQCPKCTLLNLTSGDDKAVKKGLPAKKQRKPKKKKTSNRRLEDELDKAWSILIKLIAEKKCEHCSKTKYLNSHHIYSRAKKSVRWSTMNGICLCVGCHIGVNFSAHKTPTEFTEWLVDYKGMPFMSELRFKANFTSHYADFEKELILKELNAEINRFQSL